MRRVLGFVLRVPAYAAGFAAMLVAPVVAQPSPPPSDHHPGPRPAAPSHGRQHSTPHHIATHTLPRTPPRTATKPASPPPPVTASQPTPPPPPPDKGSVTGLPLPRYASLRTDDVNFRAGPGTRYPIEWVYKRRDLPVEIEREFDVWRLVRDPENNRGWVHTATLAAHRTLVVTGHADQVLRAAPRDDAAAVAKLEPGVIGRVRDCKAAMDWCQVQVKDYKGWMKREAFWGTKPDEAVQ